MSIRHSVKAILIRDGRILLNRCVRRDGSTYFDLPGGGQKLYESKAATLIREVQEETGYLVRPLRFAATAEEIYQDLAMREKYPDYTHRLFSIYLAELIGGEQQAPAEPDFATLGSEWVSLSALPDLPAVLPLGIKEALPRILAGEIVDLGTISMDWKE
ncbi:MAG: NUDIX domain-containing protein [Ruminococcaceae bacterium]|nr:NUDIX domain-containing protein [Oscillospiraceae bacterium]